MTRHLERNSVLVVLAMAGTLLSCNQERGSGSSTFRSGWDPAELQSFDRGMDPSRVLVTEWQLVAEQQTSGEITGPFDWEYLLSEKAPRGLVTLYGMEGQAPWQWTGRLDRPTSIFFRDEPAELAIRSDLAARLKQCFGAGSDCSRGDQAWWLYERGRLEHRQGDRAAALATFEASVEGLSEQPCSRLLLENRVGRFLMKKGEGVAAARYLRSGQSLVPPECPMVTAERHLLEGEYLQAYGDSDLSRRSLQLALAQLLELAPESRLVVEAALLSGIQMIGAGSAQRADEYLDIASAVLQAYPDDPLAVDLWLSRGRRYRLLNDLSQVREALEQATASFEASGGGGGLGEMRLLISLSQQEADAGDLLAAEQINQRVLKIARTSSPGNSYEALALSYVAQFYRQIREFKLAQDYAERMLVVRQRFGERSPTAMRSLATLGEIAAGQGDYERAERLFERVLGSDDLATRHGRVVALARLGDLAWRRGQTDKAISLYQRALIESDTSGHFRRLIGIHTSLARALLTKGRFDEAEGHLNRAMKRLGTDYVNDTWRGEILHAQSQVARARGDFEGELLYLETAMTALDTLMSDRARSDELQGEWSARFQPVYHSLAGVHLERGEVGLAFEVFERHKARRFLDRLTERRRGRREAIPQTLRDAQRQTWEAYDALQQELHGEAAAGDPEVAENSLELERLQRRLYRRRQELSDQALRLAQREYGDLASIVVTAEAAAKNLEQGTVAVSFEVGEKGAIAFVIEARRPVTFYEIDRSREHLTQDVGLLRELISGIRPGFPRYESRRQVLDFEAARLFDLLLGPAREAIERAERVLIVPDGPLFTLPFSALRPTETDGGVGPALGTRVPLHFAPSASVYFGLRRSAAAVDHYDYDFTALADPTPRTAQRDLAGLAMGGASQVVTPLPFSRQEVSEISALYPEGRSRLLLGAEATEAFLKRATVSSRVIHFATHGTVDHLYPLNSGLMLSAGEGSGEGSAETVPSQASGRSASSPTERDFVENGWLQAWEVLDQVRLETDLVVLSACETGLGSARGTEGLIGLTRAFHYAGAPSVVSSLWRVADNGTAEFMRRFYSNIRQGEALAEALRSTQHDLASGLAGERYRAPYYWAGFQLSGDWR